MSAGNWCIFYEDGSTYDSSQGDPASAPGWGVVVIAQNVTVDPAPGAGRRRRLITGQYDPLTEGQDWYIYRDEVWFAINLMGLCQYIMEPGLKIIKMGRWVHPATFAEMMDRAQAWVEAEATTEAET